MGYKDKNYKKDLHQQAFERLNSMLCYGESKHAAMNKDGIKGKIFSRNTRDTYYKHIKYFIRYIKEQHPEVTNLMNARQYVNEWLEFRVNSPSPTGGTLSAYTIHTEKAALVKLFGISPDDDDYFLAPVRKREDISRSRLDTVRDKHFSEANNAELIAFCKGTGLRRRELCKLQGQDLLTRKEIEDQIRKLKLKHPNTLTEFERKQLNMLMGASLFGGNHFIIVQKGGKGGKKRISPIIGPKSAQIVTRIQDTPPDKKVWEYVNSNADIHSYRADYANNLYKLNARDTDALTNKELYICRKDEKGKKLDRRAMLITSKALGHNRISVIANNYLRGL